MKNCFVFLLFFLFYMQCSNTYAQCDSTETIMCFKQGQADNPTTTYEISCIDSNRLTLRTDYSAWGENGFLGKSYILFSYDSALNLILRDAPGKTKDSYTWFPSHLIATYTNQRYFNMAWYTYQQSSYTYTGNGLLAQATTMFYSTNNILTDSIIESYFYDSNGNDTLYEKETFKNGQHLKKRTRKIYVNNLNTAVFEDKWMDSISSFIPNELVSYHYNSFGYQTRIYYFTYSNSTAQFIMDRLTMLSYLSDTLISYKLIVSYADSTPDERFGEVFYTYYPDGKLQSVDYNSYAGGGSTRSYEYDAYDSLKVLHLSSSSHSGIWSASSCYYYHYYISGDSSLCHNDTIILTAPLAANYLWNTGDTTRSIRVYDAGEFQCTITRFDGKIYQTSPRTIFFAASMYSNFGAYLNIYSSGGSANCGGTGIYLGANSINGFSYYWIKDFVDTISNSQIIFPAQEGSTYQVYAMKSNGCSLKSDTFVVASNTIQVITSSAKGKIICPSDSTILSTNYDTAFHYIWSVDGQVILNQDTNRIYAKKGYYTVEINSLAGCSGTGGIVISNRTNPVVNLINQNSILVASSTSAVNYQWFLDSIPFSVQNDSLPIQAQGVYAVTVTDINGCSASVDYTFACSLNLTSNLTDCIDSCSWQIVSNSQGELPFTYYWNNDSTTNELQDLCPGIYKLIQTDAHGCIAADSVLLGNETLIIDIDSLKSTSCIGCNDGSIFFSTSGAYAILYPQGDTSFTNSFLNLSADTFGLCAFTSNGCSNCRTVIVHEDPLTILSNENIKSEVIVYPNPFTDKATFIFPKENNYVVVLSDILGREIAKFESHNKKTITINRAMLHHGIYYYQVTKDKINIANGKLVVE